MMHNAKKRSGIHGQLNLQELLSISSVSLLDAVISALGPDAVATSERDLRHIQVLFFLQHLSKRVVIL